MHRIAPQHECLTLVIAAYNEADALPALQPRIAAALDAAEREGLEARVLYVDDGSRDGTWNVLRGIANGDRRVSLAALAARIGGSPYHLQRKFKQIVGVTPRQYADTRRFQQAKRNLRSDADVTGARSVKSVTTGKGKVVVYRDGRRLSGTWQRAGETKPMRLVDADGKDIPLRPGKTWVLLSG